MTIAKRIVTSAMALMLMVGGAAATAPIINDVAGNSIVAEAATSTKTIINNFMKNNKTKFKPTKAYVDNKGYLALQFKNAPQYNHAEYYILDDEFFQGNFIGGTDEIVHTKIKVNSKKPMNLRVFMSYTTNLKTGSAIESDEITITTPEINTLANVTFKNVKATTSTKNKSKANVTVSWDAFKKGTFSSIKLYTYNTKTGYVCAYATSGDAKSITLPNLPAGTYYFYLRGWNGSTQYTGVNWTGNNALTHVFFTLRNFNYGSSNEFAVYPLCG